jgi:hypothetical protein
VDSSGTPRRLFDAFRGPHFTLLGFGESCAGPLQDVGTAHRGLIKPVSVGAPGSGADLVDVEEHARTAYGVTGDTLVLVRPDGYLALRAPGASGTAVRDYLDRVGVNRSA